MAKVPLTLTTGATIKQACERMRDRNVGAVLVTDEDTHLLGIFTGRDAVCRVLAEGMDSTRVTLGDVMTPNPTTMSPGKSAIDARFGSCKTAVVDTSQWWSRVESSVLCRKAISAEEQDRLDEETGIWERI